MGGVAALADDVVTQLPDPVRIAGPDRGATAATLAKEVWGLTSTATGRRTILFDGWHEDGWQAGLVAAGLAADHSAPMDASHRSTCTCPDQ